MSADVTRNIANIAKPWRYQQLATWASTYTSTKERTINYEEQVAEYLTSNIPHNNSEHQDNGVTKTRATGVYFLIDWNEVDDDPENIEIFDNFQEI